MRNITDSERIARDVIKSSSDVPYLTDDLEHYIFDIAFTGGLDTAAEQLAAQEVALGSCREAFEGLEAENERLWAVYKDVYRFLETEGFLNIGQHPATPYEKKVSELEHKLIALFNEKYEREGEAARRVLEGSDG